jgi:hypothetical protein
VRKLFNRIVPDDVLRVKIREIDHATIRALQADLDAWLACHSSARPHLRYRNEARGPS